ncbi:MAG: aldehyde dehydrogenase [Bacteroidetes bacterium]|nr:aldehyde dehydrogenase [Bacteroidota bacterium]
MLTTTQPATGVSSIDKELAAIRSYYNKGITKTYAFRRQQLLLLKKALLKYEQEINEALYSDLKKSPEESYASEFGLVLAEINLSIKHLRKWMQPKRVSTNLVNLPSSSLIYRDPLGVALIIAPWNYPFQLLMIPLVGAIAGGNCAVLKPSELSSATSHITAKIIEEIFSPEYIKIVQGDGASVIPNLMRSFRFDHIFYTGSIPVGKIIYQMAAPELIPVTLELGGKSPVIVEADANIEVAARRIAIGKFLNAGQTCIAPDYLLIHSSVKAKFIDAIKKTIEEFYSEDPSDSSSYGKIINERRFDALINYLSQGKIIAGGNHDKSKLYISPTIIDHVAMDVPLMKEEIFGPILPIHEFTDMRQALNIIQQNPNPLSLYIFTSNTKKEKEWVNAVSFGSGCVNNTAWQFANHHLPFGGVGYSGMGAYHGKYTFDVFTHAKPVMKTPNWFDPNIKYPPFKGKLKWFKMFIK